MWQAKIIHTTHHWRKHLLFFNISRLSRISCVCSHSRDTNEIEIPQDTARLPATTSREREAVSRHVPLMRHISLMRHVPLMCPHVRHIPLMRPPYFSHVFSAMCHTRTHGHPRERTLLHPGISLLHPGISEVTRGQTTPTHPPPVPNQRLNRDPPHPHHLSSVERQRSCSSCALEPGVPSVKLQE